jgi:glycosyltransferase involved in cell wall biosynthesis
MAKVAVIDLGFHWPSRVGSITHTFGAASLLVEHGHDVRLFCLSMPDVFPRGEITAELPFDAEVIDVSRGEYTPEIVPERMGSAVDAFLPDAVLFGEGWSMKNWVAARFIIRYRCLLRFYAYEMLCPFATLFSNLLGGRVCGNDCLADAEACRRCFDHAYPPERMDELCGERGSLTAFECRASRYFSEEYRDTLRSVITWSDACLPQNRLLAERLTELKGRAHIVPPGIHCDEWPVTPCPDNKTVRFLMPGRIDQPYKGFEFAREAVRRLRRERDDFVVQITTSDVGLLEAGVESVGLHPREEMPRLYAAADVTLALPEWLEPLPYVGIEAFACGRPLIATRCGGMIDLVDDSPAGVLVDPGDIDGLCEAMEMMIDRPDERRRRGEAARERALACYDWEVLYKRHYGPLLG